MHNCALFQLFSLGPGFSVLLPYFVVNCVALKAGEIKTNLSKSLTDFFNHMD